MGRRKRGKSLVQMDDQAWKDNVIFTAMLLGGDFQQHGAVKSAWVANDGATYAYSRYECARKWLWRKHGIHVRKDGSIYHREDLTSEEKFHSP